ncbi:MAG: GHKL domain-containing protein [Faecalicatena sp.]|uniref:sensor histidine kinase n=1 Tax=Faecalicatena sp. TaxID=2005360 RepID=UPI00258CC995|nr:ATP-binding protein [Faecalicatena sp.]MCI6465641.1 GHKL domain-containing protein [Faecalicatena sp.]MDY5618084.1 ATP-binding protein [Lachnospiraceae bacterium]
MDKIDIIAAAFDFMGFILYWVQTWFFYQTICSFLEPRKNHFCRAAAFLICCPMCIMVIFPRDVFNITANLPLFLVVLMIGFRQSLLVKGSIVLLFFPIIISLNFLTQELTGWIWNHYFHMNQLANTMVSNVMILWQVLFWFIFSRISKKKFREMTQALDTRSWLLLDAICLASLAAVISCVYYTPEQSYKIWLCMLACMITNISAIRLVYYLAEHVRGKLVEKNLKLQQDYYQELEANQIEIRKFRHDMNNHFSVVSELLEDGKEAEAKEYFRNLSGQLRARSRTFCKDSIVNAVINSKYNRAVEQGIDCFFNIEIDALWFLDNLDICTIFSNTLDNAIEACMKVEQDKRRISVKARCMENGYFSYEISNSKNQEIQVEEGHYKTWKRNTKSHGIGIENVRDVVKRYRGTMEISYDENTFCVLILISENSNLS